VHATTDGGDAKGEEGICACRSEGYGVDEDDGLVGTLEQGRMEVDEMGEMDMA